MDNGKNSYGVSFIQTSAGAMITGEIKRYATYKELMEETAPTRLASVSNASRDHEQYLRGEIDTDYNVPEDHVGGILYQRDFINSTWILLYTDSDLSIPTFVEWDNILHVPAWVGGVSNNRVKLVQNTYAVPRTTYYSFGNYRLVLPPANHASVKLGDEIVLEQYENYGAVLYEHIDGEYSTSDQETVTVGGTIYNVYYTVPYYDFEVDPSNQDPVYGQPITACAYKFICTETDGGTRCWRPVLVKDNISALITDLRQRDTDHILADDPHPNYILKREARNYLWSDISVATEFNEGKVRLARQEDIMNGERGAIAVTPYWLKQYTTTTFSVLGHVHRFSELTEIPFVISITNENKAREDQIVTPKALTAELEKKQNVLTNGTYISIDNNTVNCTIQNASVNNSGIVSLVDEITDVNKYDDTVAVTPKAINAFVASTKLNGFIMPFGDITNGTNQFPFTTGTRGCVLLPFKYELDNIQYSVAMEWGLTRQMSTNENEPCYFMMQVPTYYKIKKIIFANMTIMPIGQSATDISNTDSVVNTISYHRCKDSTSSSTISAENDYVAAILLWFNQFSTTGINKAIRLKWFVVGLVDQNVIWDSAPKDTGSVLDPYAGYFDDVKSRLESASVVDISNARYLLDSCYEFNQLNERSLSAAAKIERAAASVDGSTTPSTSDNTVDGIRTYSVTQERAGDHPRSGLVLKYTFDRTPELESMYEYYIAGLSFTISLSDGSKKNIVFNKLYITKNGNTLIIDKTRSKYTGSTPAFDKFTKFTTSTGPMFNGDLWDSSKYQSSEGGVIYTTLTDWDDYVYRLYLIMGYTDTQIIMKVVASMYYQDGSRNTSTIKYTVPESTTLTRRMIPLENIPY